MKIIKYPERIDWPELLKRPVMESGDMDSIVLPILEDVKKRGDQAVLDYTKKFDKIGLTSVAVTDEEFGEAELLVSEDLKSAISIAVKNIEAFHRAQQTEVKKITTTAGVECWQKATAIQKVGLYIPGGTAVLFSTVLMLAIPAKIAGCREVILCTPPDYRGKINPAVLYAAKITGVNRVFKCGGVQAIAAMAYGTESIPKVFKIFGPGNQYVTAAKQLVSRGDVAIDMPAGPSEVLVIADESTSPAYAASDLLSQAEHGYDSQVILTTTSENVADKIKSEVEHQLNEIPRKEYASRSLDNSRIFILKNTGEIMEMVNEYAPEHLIISTADAHILAEQVINAGSVFIGPFSPESAGDYASGTNHTLPTNGYAKAYNGINLDDFVKKITFQQISREGLMKIGPAIMKMAETEELAAHKNAVYLRINS